MGILKTGLSLSSFLLPRKKPVLPLSKLQRSKMAEINEAYGYSLLCLLRCSGIWLKTQRFLDMLFKLSFVTDFKLEEEKSGNKIELSKPYTLMLITMLLLPSKTNRISNVLSKVELCHLATAWKRFLCWPEDYCKCSVLKSIRCFLFMGHRH